MNIIENWKLLITRTQSERSEMNEYLFKTHMGAFDELRANGNKYRLNGKLISQITNGMTGEDKLELIADICRQFVSIDGDIFEKHFKIINADEFPNGIYMVISSILEELDGSFNVVYPERKMTLFFAYETCDGGIGTLGEKLDMLKSYYPWVEVNLNVSKTEKDETANNNYVEINEYKTVFIAEKVQIISEMRTSYTGRLLRGGFSVNDTVVLTDGKGFIITPQCSVLGIYTTNGEKVTSITASGILYEVVLSNQPVKGDYNGLLLLRLNDIESNDRSNSENAGQSVQNNAVYNSTEKTYYCPQCGEIVSAKLSQCNKCGADLAIEPGQAVDYCSCCHGVMSAGDIFCRTCGIDYTLFHVKKSIEDENQIKHAHFAIERMIEYYNRYDETNDPKKDLVLTKLLNLIDYTPLFLPVEMNIQTMFGNINPAELKPGDTIKNEQAVRMKLLTAHIGDMEVLPMFTKGEYAKANVVRMYPQDYLPAVIKMKKTIVVNIFNKEKFALPVDYLTHMLETVTGKKENYNPEGITLDEGVVIDNKYKLLERINTSANTASCLAKDLRVNVIWSVRVYNKHIINTDCVISEVNLLKKLNHPSIMRLVDIVTSSDYLFLISEHTEGSTLYDIVYNYGKQPENLVIGWAKQLCDTLTYLSSLSPQIVHRDINPRNIILKPDGHLILTGFDIAREYIPGLQADETCLGTRGYAAPEQYGIAQTDCRSDIYSFGMTIHQLVTGKDPTKPPYETMPIRNFDSNLSKGLEYIIEKCTQLNPDDRYQTPSELMKDLENIEKLPPKRGVFGALKSIIK